MLLVILVRWCLEIQRIWSLIWPSSFKYLLLWKNNVLGRGTQRTSWTNSGFCSSCSSRYEQSSNCRIQVNPFPSSLIQITIAEHVLPLIFVWTTKQRRWNDKIHKYWLMNKPPSYSQEAKLRFLKTGASMNNRKEDEQQYHLHLQKEREPQGVRSGRFLLLPHPSFHPRWEYPIQEAQWHQLTLMFL